MTDFEKIWDFQNLYQAHKVARCGKRNTREVIEFELNLSQNLVALSDSLKEQTYLLSGYYQFYVYEPKKRCINALHYRDRVVQHCLCDEILAWFALYYLDGLDRLIKERLRIRYYSRYMDDCILIHHDKAYLKYCLGCMRSYVNKVLQLEFNEKTQIFPLKNGVEYLGFHFYLSENGKVIRKLKTQAKKRYKSRLKKMKNDYRSGDMSFEEIKQALNSYHGHLKHGHTYHLQRSAMKHFVLCRT